MRPLDLLTAAVAALALAACAGAGAGTAGGDAGPGDASDGRPAAPGIAVATWNVHRFFDTACDSGSCDSGDFEALPGEAQFAARADSIAAAIEALEADVVALQEIENEACVEALRLRLGPAWPVVVLGEHGTAGTVDVAVAARGALVEVRTHRDQPIPLPGGGTTTFARELLEVHLEIGGAPVVVFAAHFRSQYDDEPERRLAEAMAARDLAAATAEERPEAIVVLAGDLNDVPGSPPLEALEEGGALDGLWDELPPEDAWTWGSWSGTKLLDHLALAAGRYVDGTATVLRDPGSGTWGASDHAAVRARVAATAAR